MSQIQKTTNPPDCLSSVARRKLNLPDSHFVCAWEVLGTDGRKVTLKEMYTKSKGINKGNKGYRGKSHFIFISDQEHLQEQLQWERTTRKCFACGGDGIQWYGWSKLQGNLYRDCKRCEGTGTYPQ